MTKTLLVSSIIVGSAMVYAKKNDINSEKIVDVLVEKKEQFQEFFDELLKLAYEFLETIYIYFKKMFTELVYFYEKKIR